MIRVKATREGLDGRLTSSGWRVDNHISYCALPSIRALGRHVYLINPLNGNTAVAEVLDVGPHNEHDDMYVFNGARPLSEQGFHTVVTGQPPVKGSNNGAGIDLGDKVWKKLGMTDNTDVLWEFL